MTVIDAPPARRRLRERLPAAASDRRVRVIAWLNLIANLAIIGTGGAVRLTGSGLGCDVWPGCTSTSFLPGIDEGLHGLIEFGNRTLSGVLGILAVLAVLFVLRLRASRKDLWIHAWILFAGIIVQALIGLIVVQTKLEMSTVGLHYFLSAVLVGVATSFVLRVYRQTGPRVRSVPVWLLVLTHVATLLLAAVVVLGILTTGSGPHSGDEDVIRDSTAWEQLAHLHALMGYALIAVLLALLAGAIATGQQRYLRAVVALIGIVAVQIIVGITQANLGIPPLLVGIHMVLAGVTVAATVALVDATKRHAAPNDEHSMMSTA